jgi:predicted AAA+ superfamily ATPase
VSFCRSTPCNNSNGIRLTWGTPWQVDTKSPGQLVGVPHVSRIPLELLQGVDRQKDTLFTNSLRFAKGLPANNALLWGARGTGKSSLVKAVHERVNQQLASDHGDIGPLALIEIHREDIPTLPALLSQLRDSNRRSILFCDDLSFVGEDAAYKSLKAVLEGGIEGRPENVIFYATSNRRHLMARDMIDNERSTAIHVSEAVEEKVSLSDRFGLWLGFHNSDQQTYLTMIAGYIEAYGLEISEENWRPKAIEWTVTRGSRSGRVAWQFIQNLSGELGQTLNTKDEAKG